MQGPMIPSPAALGVAAATGLPLNVVQPSASQKQKQYAIHVLLAIGTAASIAAMAISPAAAVFLMAGILVANVPYSAYKERQLTRLPALRQLNNYLREDANKLESAVDALGQEIDELRPEAERAADVEGQLKMIAEEQGKNTDTLVELVEENGRIVKEMQDNLRQVIVQDMLKIVMSSDRNNDGTFSENETGMLALKISMQLQEEDVEFDQEKFKKVVKKNPTMGQIIKIVKRLVPSAADEEGGEDGKDVDEDEEEDFDMFHMKGGGDDKAQDRGLAPRPSLGLSRQPATRKMSRQKKIAQLSPSVATTARRYVMV